MDLWCPTLEHSFQFKHRNNSKISKQIFRIIYNAPWYATNDTLHYDLNVPDVRETRLKSSVRDTPTDWSNTPTY